MTKSYKEIKKEKEGTDVQVQEACWVGYKQVGLKKKGDRMVPNCVKEEISEAKEDESEKQPSVKEKTDDSDKLKGDLQKKDAEIATLKQKSETDKTKAVAKDTKKMVNPETGEPLLQVGIAYKIMRDKVAKEKAKEEVKEEWYSTNEKRKTRRIERKSTTTFPT